MTNDFYDVDGNLIRSEPIDYAELQAENNAINLAYLAETDWYITRKYETGKAVPQEILIKRQEARDAIGETHGYKRI